jgi:methionyl-tRNA synthetase
LLWAACAERGDLYRKAYSGLYCGGCEVFYHPEELEDGRCREHGTDCDDAEAAGTIDRSLRNFDFRRALEAIIRIGDEGNRHVEPG